jgi:hypothetical protein
MTLLSRSGCLALVSFALVLHLPSTSRAAEAVRRDQVLFTTLLLGRYNPIGLDAQGSLAFQHPIGESDDLLLKTRFWSIQATGTYNPAEWSGSVAAEIEPIAVFQLRGLVEYRGYAGGFGELLSYDDVLAPIDDSSLQAAADLGLHYATWRTTLRLEPKLRAAVGPIGIQNVFGINYGYVAVRDPTHDVYYDPAQDLLMPANGLTFSNQFSVVYLGGPVTAGGLYDFIAPRGLGAANHVHRLGAFASYTFFDNPRVWINKPTLFAVANFNLVHRGRAGPIPTVIAGISTETDLFYPRP